MEHDYSQIINQRAQHVFDVMLPRVTADQLNQIRKAFELAREAHAPQRRKTGEPYILHPIAVATIAAEELMLDASSVMAAFLHDVVEDTDYTIDDIRERFGDDVAFLVKVVTKEKKVVGEESKQVANFRQMLNSLQYDVRALLVKLSDRLHNMRTLSSMRPDKQMKIAGETDYFYAPLANRLGLYRVKTELENLSFRFRCPREYDEIQQLIARDREQQTSRLTRFCHQIRTILAQNGITAKVGFEYRHPYSLWRKMHKYGDDFNHLKYRHFTTIEYEGGTADRDKEMALHIYSILTNHFNEKPGGISNYIDSPKENGYQSFHVKLLPDFGRWQEVHISSSRMIRNSQLGCISEQSADVIASWIDKFRDAIREISDERIDDDLTFIDKVVTSFYNDDIMTFTPKGRAIILPQKATVIDFAYEVDAELGNHAKYARVNGFLTPVRAPLRRGDVVEVFTDPDCHPTPEWLDVAVGYKARREIRTYLRNCPIPRYNRCPHCKPIPQEEVIGFREADGRITLHKRDCPTAIRLASQYGDSIVSVDFAPTDTLYPVTIEVRAVDRAHLFIDLVDCISNTLGLAIGSINTSTIDNIVTLRISFELHSISELREIITHISSIPAVDEVKETDL
ncbi:MAG: RelA/SpoT family protein [Muribaculaceae bacterium]